LTERLKAEGYDGVIIDHGEFTGGKEVIAFSPTQIKSVFNRGMFDPKDPKILYQQQSQGPRGAIRRLDDGRYIVGLFKDRDASTVIHETGHFFLENLREAATENAPEEMRVLWGQARQALGMNCLISRPKNWSP
jgi:hypothetical protein